MATVPSPADEQEVRSIVHQIVEHYQPERILLFGSHARGDVGPDSDIDLLVIKRTSQRWIDRLTEARLLVSSARPLDIIVFTPEEFEARAASPDPVFRAIIAEAMVVHDARAA